MYHQKNVSSFSSSFAMDRREHVVCPKPRRFGLLNGAVHDLPVRSLRWHLNHQTELSDPRGGTDLLDAILTKGYNGHGLEAYSYNSNNNNNNYNNSQVASPPPFFNGSPPSRVANPLIQDARFGDDKMGPHSPGLPPPPGLPSPPSSAARKNGSGGGGCVRPNFGNKPAVRIEGFDCLDRDRRNCSIPALA